MQLDTKNNCVWVPLGKTLIPFHISTVKNISFQHEGRVSLLRLNFNVPGKVGKHAVRFPEPTDFPSPPSYIQELLFRSTKRDHFEDLVADFKKMQRDYHPDAGKQTASRSLVLESGKRAVLDGVSMKPSFSGKKCGCRLELHANGFRFRSNKEEVLDILFEDIERVVYMPADESAIFVFHFHLKKSVLLGSKSVFDVQVNAQVGHVQVDETDKKKRRRLKEAEEDELFEQQWDLLEEVFEGFVEAVKRRTHDKLKIETCDVDFPITGSFNYSSETLYFTETALVCVNCNLPFLVIPFDIVEVVAFERAGMVAKSMDLTFIFKDYSKAPVTIGGVSSSLKLQLQQALDERDVIILEGATSMKWSVVLKRISENLDEFVNKQEGWIYFAPKGVTQDSPKQKKPQRGNLDEETNGTRPSGGTQGSDYEGGSDGGQSWDSDPSGSVDEDSDDEDDSGDSEDSFNSQDEFDSDESADYGDSEDSSPPRDVKKRR